MTENLSPPIAPSIPNAPAVPSGWRPVRNSPRIVALVVAIVLAGMLSVLAAWRLPPFSGTLQSTDDAYVRGAVTVISSQVSGYVWEVLVHDYETVRAGQAVARIDNRTYQQRVEQAKAVLDAQLANLANHAQTLASRKAALLSAEASAMNAHAQLDRARADHRRAQELSGDGSVSAREAEQTLATLRQAEAATMQAQAGRQSATQDVRSVVVNRDSLAANVEAARAALHAAEIDLENTIVRAPTAGQLGEIGVRTGQYVTNGTQLVSLVPPTLWVIANFKEAQTFRMMAGQPASVAVDALDGARIAGRVERIAPATGSEFAVLRPDNATGNFTKVAQRISVRISIDPGQPLAARLRPGISVEASIDTSGKAYP